MTTRNEVIIVGGGLAGCEAAWQAAEHGCKVDLFEMRPDKMTPAHSGAGLAELVCSNSLGSRLPDRASGLLQNELHLLGNKLHPNNSPSLLLSCAQQCAVPAGDALAVDREVFSQLVADHILAHPNIRIIRQEVTSIPIAPCVIASGPLTSDPLANSIQLFAGQENLFFFDAIAPTIFVDSINMDIAFRASRFNRGEQAHGDYINCPMNKEQYLNFLDALLTAQKITLRDFEVVSRSAKNHFFEGCLPIEELGARGVEALTFGPMRPIGITNPHDGSHPYAVVQLRQDNLAGTLYNLVGFQTNMTFPEQKRVFSLIPGLEQAEFARLGQMHRNTYVASPLLLNPTLEARQSTGVFFAGQITGVEGYMGNIATGWLAGNNIARWIKGKSLMQLPPESMLGAILQYITHAELETFHPVKAIFGILPELETQAHGRRARSAQYAERAISSLEKWITSQNNGSE